MFRHDHVAVNVSTRTKAHGFERFDEDGAGFGLAEEGLSVAATKGDEVEMPTILKAPESPGHKSRLVALMVEEQMTMVRKDERIARCAMPTLMREKRASEWGTRHYTPTGNGFGDASSRFAPERQRSKRPCSSESNPVYQ